MERQFIVTVPMPKGITVDQMALYIASAVANYWQSDYAQVRQMGFRSDYRVDVEPVPIKRKPENKL